LRARAGLCSTATGANVTAALSLQDISCTFVSRDDRAQRYTAVSKVTIDVAPGEFVSVVGPTGCGKSTLLNVAAGLLEPSSGSVRVFGEPLVGINRRAGYMFQSEALMPWRTARDNVLAGLQFRGLTENDAAALADDWLKRVGLSGFGDRYPHQLSGGMRKRTSLAQTLVLDPDIILMDEPFSALDIQTRQLMENELLELWAGGGDARRAAPSKSPTPTGGGREAAGGGSEHDARRAAPSKSPTPTGAGREAAGGGSEHDARRAAPGKSPAPAGAGREAAGGATNRKAVLFITHDLDEAIAMSDRVVVLSAGPASHPMGEFVIDLVRPRDVVEVRVTPRFIELHKAIWDVLREEVLKGYAQQKRAA
jgi:NitT/TauT family transport system ATP-binding protein